MDNRKNTHLFIGRPESTTPYYLDGDVGPEFEGQYSHLYVACLLSLSMTAFCTGVGALAGGGPGALQGLTFSLIVSTLIIGTALIYTGLSLLANWYYGNNQGIPCPPTPRRSNSSSAAEVHTERQHAKIMG